MIGREIHSKSADTITIQGRDRYEIPRTPFTELVANNLLDSGNAFTDLINLHRKMPDLMDHLVEIAVADGEQKDDTYTREELVNILFFAWMKSEAEGILDMSDKDHVNEANDLRAIPVSNRLEEMYTGHFIFHNIQGTPIVISREMAEILSILDERELLLIENLSDGIRRYNLQTDTTMRYDPHYSILRYFDDWEYINDNRLDTLHATIAFGRGVLLRMRPFMREVITSGRVDYLLVDDRGKPSLDKLYELSKRGPMAIEFTVSNRENLQSTRDILSLFGRAVEICTILNAQDSDQPKIRALRRALRRYMSAFNWLEPSSGPAATRNFSRTEFEREGGLNVRLIEETARLLTNMIIYYQGRNLIVGVTLDQTRPHLISNHLIETDPEGSVSEMDYAFRFLPRNASLRSVTEALMPVIQGALGRRIEISETNLSQIDLLQRFDRKIFNLLTDPTQYPYQHLLRFMYSMIALSRAVNSDPLFVTYGNTHTTKIPTMRSLTLLEADEDMVENAISGYKIPDVITLPNKINDDDPMQFWREMNNRKIPFSIVEIKYRLPLKSQTMRPATKPRTRETDQMQRYLDSLSELIRREEFEGVQTPEVYLVVITPAETKVVRWIVSENDGSEENEQNGKWVISRDDYELVWRFG